MIQHSREANREMLTCSELGALPLPEGRVRGARAVDGS
jgi:hypothetical protein